MHHVVHELAPERQFHRVAIDVAHALRVREEEVIPSRAASDVDVLPHFAVGYCRANSAARSGSFA